MRRTLQFESLADAVAETRRLLDGGYEPRGEWTLGQACWHLRVTQDPVIDGFPWWMGLFAPLRPVMRSLLLPKLLSGAQLKVKTMGPFVPPAELDDATEAASFIASSERFLAHTGRLHPHPGFGRLAKPRMDRVLAAHAAHHLGFLWPPGEPAS